MVTGLGGFAGAHLASALLDDGHEVAGYTLPDEITREASRLGDRVTFYPGDILDREGLVAAFGEFRPDVVFHLAAITHPGQSWHMMRRTLEINVVGSATVLAESAALADPPRLVLVSSGLVYGAAAAAEMPLTEDHPAHPVSPYAVSKLCSEELALQIWRSSGLQVVILRPFNYAGPGQSPDFVCSDFAYQIARAEAGLAPPIIEVGNLDAQRDFADVRDMMDAFVLAAELGVPGTVYNLCSGTGVSIREILDRLLQHARTEIDVRHDPARMRPADVPVFVGDAGRARRDLGWEPRRGLDETLADTLEHWRRMADEAKAGGGPS